MAKIVKDSGWDRKVLDLLKRKTVTVGIHEKDAARKEDELTNAQVGFWHEFGTADVPQRSFLRDTADRNSLAYRRFLRKAMERAAKGKFLASQAFKLVGFKVASDVKERIRAHIPPPNAPSTIKKKGSSTPLIDTGSLLNSIDFEVAE
jgi:hypothetical protein